MSISKSSCGDIEIYKSGKSRGFISDDEDSTDLKGSSTPSRELSYILTLLPIGFNPKAFTVPV